LDANVCSLDAISPEWLLPPRIDAIACTAARPHVSAVIFPHHKFKALYDTGAGPNCMSDSVYHIALKNGQVLSRINSNLKSIRTASGQSVKILGVFLIKVIFHGRPYVGPFTIVQGLASDIIIAMVAARDMALDYSVTDNKFTFRKELETTGSFQIAVRKRRELPTKQGGNVRCVVTHQGVPIRNKTIIACINTTDVIVHTDCDGEIKINFSNPTTDTITYARGCHLGTAELANDLEVDTPVTQNSAAAVAALVGAIHSPTAPSCVVPPQVAKALQPQFEEATKHLPQEIRKMVLSTLWNHWKASSTSKFDLGLSRIWKHRIRLTNNIPAYNKQFPIPLQHVPIIREHVDRWLQLGIVEPARSPYNSPIFCVKKKGGGFRLCLDYRDLNSRSLPENYSIRTPEDCMAEIGQNGGRYFIALDLTSGFYQMELDKTSRPATAFTVPPYGQLQWTRSAMGLKGCPGSFARLMDITLKGIPNVLIYIDDILIYGKSHREAICILDKVLHRLANHNLKVNIGKSTFFAHKTEYLGHTLSSKGITPGVSKTDAILQAKPPTTVKGLKSFLGMMNYFRSFVKDFAQQAGVLYNLTKVDSQWKSGQLPPHAIRIFNNLKSAIAKVVPRSFPFPNGKYHLFTDGSLGDDKLEGGLGGHLMQEGPDGKLHTIAFASRALRQHERNYSAFLLELQAAVQMIDHFDHYLRGRAFVLHTDHAPMTALSKVHSKTLHRLHSLLNDYSFEIRHVPGKKNPVADFLSRSQGPTAVQSIAAISNSQCLRQAQEEDALMGPIIKAMEEGRPPSWPPGWQRYARFFIMHQGYLCVRLPRRQGFIEDNCLRAVAPLGLRTALLREAHNSALGGHQGIFRTAERIRLAFWWPSMLDDIKAHVNKCHICQATSNKAAPYVPQHQELPQCTKPNQRIHVDLFGPIKGRDGTSKYILGITDAFTKIIRLVAIPKKEAKTVAMAIWTDWMCIYGIPMLVFSDQGAEFTSQLQGAIFDILKVKHNTTTPYWPKCNMMIERQNKELAKYLRAILFAANKASTDWEPYLPALMLSLNTAVNRATKQAPFLTMFGYDAQLPLWEDADILKTEHYQLPPQDKDCFYQWQDSRKIARQVAHDNEKMFRAQYPQQSSDNRTPQTFCQHQKVYIRIQPIMATNKKLAPKWEEGVIMERLGTTTYKVKRTNAKRKKIVITNAFHLKPRDTLQELKWQDTTDQDHGSEHEDNRDLEEDEEETTHPEDPQDPLSSPSKEAHFHGWPTPPEQVPAEQQKSAAIPRNVPNIIAALKFHKDGRSFNLDEWIGRPDITQQELWQAIGQVLTHTGAPNFSLGLQTFYQPQAVQNDWAQTPRQPPVPPPAGPPPPAPRPTPPSSMSWREPQSTSPPPDAPISPPPPAPRPTPPSPMSWRTAPSSSPPPEAPSTSPPPHAPIRPTRQPSTEATSRPVLAPPKLAAPSSSPQIQSQQHQQIDQIKQMQQMKQQQQIREQQQMIHEEQIKQQLQQQQQMKRQQQITQQQQMEQQLKIQQQQQREQLRLQEQLRHQHMLHKQEQRRQLAQQQQMEEHRLQQLRTQQEQRQAEQYWHQQQLLQQQQQAELYLHQQQQQTERYWHQQQQQQLREQQHMAPPPTSKTGAIPKTRKSPTKRPTASSQEGPTPKSPFRELSAARRRLDMTDQDTPGQRQQRQQPPPHPPKRQCQTQPLKVTVPPCIQRLHLLSAPVSNQMADRQIQIARDYQATRQDVRQWYLRASAALRPETCPPATWTAHHAGLFDAMNPHPASLYPTIVSPQKRAYPATPEEVFYSGRIEQIKQMTRPPVIKSAEDMQQVSHLPIIPVDSPPM
jgi:hypothetical protein